jgi:LEA14-like dessication related protein
VKKLTLSVAALTIAMMSYGQVQCEGMTKMKVQCKNTTKDISKLCHIHNPNHVVKSDKVSVICSGITKAKNPCKNKTKNTNGKCHLHGGKKD